jgi:hypothetical protein
VLLNCSEFNHTINLLPGVDRDDPIAIWDLFFPPSILEDIVQYTNKKDVSLQEPNQRL